MADVAAESLVNKFAFLFSICLFYSRIILNKLSIHQKTLFRKCEKTFIYVIEGSVKSEIWV